ncbi:MAG: coenzyme F420-0:L-glutamate ligase [Acidimicrobiia bacterium]
MTVEIHPLLGIPEVSAGDNLAALLVEALRRSGLEPRPGDVLVVTHKVVSKAEGSVVKIAHGDEAAYRRLVEDEAERVLRRRQDLVITKTRHGFICASAGVDRSNVGRAGAVLMPRDPDRSAHRLRLQIGEATGVDVAVLITDTFGRAWRRGVCDVAIGLSGFTPILDLRGTPDADGRPLEVTEVAIADEIAAAAELVMGKANRIPACLVRGVNLPGGKGGATDLVRPTEEDLFR